MGPSFLSLHTKTTHRHGLSVLIPVSIPGRSHLWASDELRDVDVQWFLLLRGEQVLAVHAALRLYIRGVLPIFILCVRRLHDHLCLNHLLGACLASRATPPRTYLLLMLSFECICSFDDDRRWCEARWGVRAACLVANFTCFLWVGGHHATCNLLLALNAFCSYVVACCCPSAPLSYGCWHIGMLLEDLHTLSWLRYLIKARVSEIASNLNFTMFCQIVCWKLTLIKRIAKVSRGCNDVYVMLQLARWEPADFQFLAILDGFFLIEAIIGARADLWKLAWLIWRKRGVTGAIIKLDAHTLVITA